MGGAGGQRAARPARRRQAGARHRRALHASSRRSSCSSAAAAGSSARSARSTSRSGICSGQTTGVPLRGPARLGPQLGAGVRERRLLPPGRSAAEHPRRGRAPARARLLRLQDEGRRAAAARGRGARRRRRARRSAPTGRLALDANNAYASVAEAIKAADAFAPHDIWWFEEPLVPDDIDGHAQLAARGPIPIATGEIEATAWGFGHLLRARAAHIHQTDACVCGGVGEWMKAAHAAAAFGVQVAPHWHHNLHAQLAAAISNGARGRALRARGGRLQLRGAARAGDAHGRRRRRRRSSTTSRASASATTPDAVARYTLTDA